MLPGTVLSSLAERLRLRSDTPELDASVLLASVMNQPRAWILGHPELELTDRQKSVLENGLRELERGVPLPYVLGRWEFFGLEFEVRPEVLIPRPETELLVERAVAWLQTAPHRRDVVDVGTGSGCIAVTIAFHVPDARILATDISEGALSVARRNARRHGVADRIRFVACDLLPLATALDDATLPERRVPLPQFDLLCANLPYIPRDDLENLPIFGREPTVALDGGADGLTPLRRLFAVTRRWLAPRAEMLLEIEASRADQAVALARAMFSDAAIRVLKDLAGRDRLLEMQLAT